MSDDKKDNKKDAKTESIFTPKRTVKYFFLNLTTLIVSAMIMWPLLELLFSKIDGSTYTWTWVNGILEPIIFGLIFCAIEFIGWNLFHKQK